jgi:hypothetical protein
MATITKAGTYTGNGAIKNIIVGFIPDYVRIVNFTAPAVDEWFKGLAAGTSITTTGTAAVRASPGGVTAFAGSSTEGQGFTVGIALSTNASVYYYVAVQSGPGAG